jgi:pimeloyl-ACP methyl ester carboxylesterase
MTATRTHDSGDRTVDLHVEHWGEGARVVLVHGSLATAAEEWVAQVPLADEGFHLVAPDRRGNGSSPAADDEDYLVDAEDVAALLGDGAHLVGHSYGGLGALVAASLRPEATLSLALLEPGAFALGQGHPAGRAFLTAVRDVWDDDASDDTTWVVEFLKAVGSDPDEFPPDFLAAARPLVPLVRNARPVFSPDLPLAALAEAAFPKMVVSGGHSEGFDAICDDLATRIGATRAEAAGAGHEVQFAPAINDLLLAFWRSAA